MTVRKRTRILEIITALLMIRPTFSVLSKIFSFNDGEQLRNFIGYIFPSLLASVALAIVIIARKYDRTWSKLLVLISLAANIYSDRNINYLKGFGNNVRAYRHVTSLLLNDLFHIFLFILGITAGIILVLTMFGKIKWKTRNSLLTYTYIMMGIMAFGAMNYKYQNIYYIELVFMPCLIFELQEKTDIKAIAGWAGVLAASISETLFEYLMENAQNNSDGGFLDYIDSATKYEGIRSLIFAAGILLIPLILFERKKKLERVIVPVDVDDDKEDIEVKGAETEVNDDNNN